MDCIAVAPITLRSTKQHYGRNEFNIIK